MCKVCYIFLFLFVNCCLQLKAQDKKKIIFITAPNNHGKGEHEYKAGCNLLAKWLNENAPEISSVVYESGWPKDSTVFDEAITIVLYCNGGNRHLLIQHMQEMDRLMKKGIGLVALHNAIEAPAGDSLFFLAWLGGYFEPYYSVNPRWKAVVKDISTHPVANGVMPFSIKDEWYYHIRFADSMQHMPILQALPPVSSVNKQHGPYTSNESVRKAIVNGELQTLAWVYSRTGGGRSFSFTGAHFHRNWTNDNFRKLILNAITWTAKITIPPAGVIVPTLSKKKLNNALH